MKYSYISGAETSISAYMKKALKGLNEIRYVNNKNIKTLLQLYLYYIQRGYKPIKPVINGTVKKWNTQDYSLSKIMSEKSNIPQIVILNFFSALYDLSRIGKVDYKLYDPLTAKTIKESSKNITGNVVLSNIGKSLFMGLNLVPVVLLISGAYLVYTMIPRKQ